MKILIFTRLGIGGTEKAACRWSCGLKERGHCVTIMTFVDGPRRRELEQHGVPVHIVVSTANAVADAVIAFAPDVIHTHAPGKPYWGDVLGEALAMLSLKIPVVQTNVFGRLENPSEDAWVDHRLFVSWTSCVQAARRSRRRMDEFFFRRNSVAVYPLDALEPATTAQCAALRQRLGVATDEVLFGRLSRPSMHKWTNLAVDAFRLALRGNRKIKLLLRQPPPAVAEALRTSEDARHFIILPVTTDAQELYLTMSALDVTLHTSRVGESFGYGIAEPMNLARPVITHSVPWSDQAQIELVRHGECGLIANTAGTMKDAILTLAHDTVLRSQMGENAQKHIRALANSEASITRLEAILCCAVEKRDNLFAAEDLQRAKCAAAYLDAHQ